MVVSIKVNKYYRNAKALVNVENQSGSKAL